jgi:hypothetical protein
MKGILFKPELIKEIIEGRKTVTRRAEAGLRLLNENPNDWELMIGSNNMDSLVWLFRNTLSEILDVKPRYQVGEVVYIKEAWCADCHAAVDTACCYLLGRENQPASDFCEKWHSPLFMPERFARYFIKMLSVRAERLQEITEEDAVKEGITIMAGTHQAIAKNSKTGNLELIGQPEPFTARYHYGALWDSLNKAYPWEMNPWVFRYEFESLKG